MNVGGRHPIFKLEEFGKYRVGTPCGERGVSCHGSVGR
jgi:hypothetical protein